MFFVQTRENLTQSLNFFEKSPKIIHFCKFLNKFFANFQYFLACGRLRTRTPQEADPSWLLRWKRNHWWNHNLSIYIHFGIQSKVKLSLPPSIRMQLRAHNNAITLIILGYYEQEEANWILKRLCVRIIRSHNYTRICFIINCWTSVLKEHKSIMDLCRDAD